MPSKKKPLRIFDTTLRDGHQSLLATRLRLEDMLPILEMMDDVGFAAMEVWGGATFDVTHRFLVEDPWERLATIKKHVKKTPLSMLLRGQNLVGYRNYADDVVEAFVEQAAETGIDQFRVFDALNDERNFEASFKAIKKAKKDIQGTICYSLTQRRLGGEIYNIAYFVKKAKKLEDMGADSLCIKDMAGICSPYDAFELITALKKAVKLPIQLHTHYTSGMGSMTYLKAAEAGVDVVDTALAPLALRSSQPALEPIVVTLEGTERDTGLELAKLLDIDEKLEKIAPKYRNFLDSTKLAQIDTAVLMHQVPGGMLSNMVNQLKEADALDRIGDVYRELPKTRAELGYPPLVTPTSQIVGIQAVQNVLFGRYKMISTQVKDLCYGLYGTTPAPIAKDVQKNCLKGYERGESPISSRPADILKPELEKAKEATKGLAKNIKDVLIYALFPTTGEKFLKWKYGIEPVPEELKPKKAEEAAPKPKPAAAEKAAPEKGPGLRAFNVFLDEEYYRVEVEEVGGRPVISSVKQAPKTASPSPAAKAPEPVRETKPTVVEGGAVLRAPLNGLVIDVKVKEGDKVKKDDIVMIVEAMKMENQIKAPADGVVKQVLCKKGDNVEKNKVLIVFA